MTPYMGMIPWNVTIWLFHSCEGDDLAHTMQAFPPDHGKSFFPKSLDFACTEPAYDGQWGV